MKLPEVNHCPGTLAEGHSTYSPTCLKRMFQGKKVSHVLPYTAPSTQEVTGKQFMENQQRISISGVQEKFSLRLEKNTLRLTQEGEQGQYILKPIPRSGNKPGLMPANEHLTMQLARQVFGIETAENALVFFQNGQPAYITKRFDLKEDGTKRGQEDFAALAGKTPQTHGTHYKYSGNYLDLFILLKRFVPAYKIEAPKLLQLLLFNYLFSNGDAHLKNFSLIETRWGDYRLSPAYDLLNSHIHIDDAVFALEEGLLPKNLAQGTIKGQFLELANQAEIPQVVVQEMFMQITSVTHLVEKFIAASFLDDATQRNYSQAYRYKLKKMTKE